VTEFSSYVPFSPDATEALGTTESLAQYDIPQGQDVTEFSSYVPFSPPGANEAQITTESPLQSNISGGPRDVTEFSSYVVDFDHMNLGPTPPTPEWHNEPAISPFRKGTKTMPRRTTRSVARQEEADRHKKEEERQRNLEKAKISTLSEEWENKVGEAVRAGHPPDYTAADFARVVPPQQGGFTDNWLNDESVNGYLKLATKFHNARHPSSIPKSHAFPSFLLKQIAEKGYKGVERWAKRAKIGGKDLLETHTIFIPVNNGSHWTLMVVYPGARIAHYYDSMGRNRANNGRQWFDLLKTWLHGELGTLYNEREWSFFDKQSPQQDNSSDCGVFAITTAKMLILGADVLGYGPQDIPLQRKRIVAELINGNFL
jgi:sentrin-specific protease 1